MMENKLLSEIIFKLNIERKVFFEILPEQQAVFRGMVELAESSVTLEIDFSNYFPLEFPRFRIKNAQRFYPHVDRTGAICLFDDSSLLIKTNEPAQMLLDAYDRAIEILSIDSSSKEYMVEVAKEFNAYWAEVSKLVLYTNLSPCIGKEYLHLSVIRAEGKMIVSDTIIDSECILKNHFGVSLDKKGSINCLLIRLREFIIPPIQEVYTWKWLRNFILKNITASQKKEFNNLLAVRKKSLHQFLILSVPAENHDIVISFWIHCKSSQYKKVEKMSNCKVTPVMIRPIDYTFLLKRSGGITELASKSVLLLGCGSVGGYVASNLCQSGICNLDILDQDILTEENIYRHILGFKEAVKKGYKADLLKEYLENQYPFIDIDSLGFIDRSVEAFIQNTERLKGYDLIVSALGEPTINLEINRILNEKGITTPFIVCFNEPYGIGGHAVAVNLQSGGCLRCMYTDLISNELVPFLVSLVAAGQNFKKSLSGCAGAFVEYTALDSQQTALLTTRLAMDVRAGRCEKSTILSWFGSSDSLINHGFKVSDYYDHMANQKSYNSVKESIPINERCPICSKKNLS